EEVEPAVEVTAVALADWAEPTEPVETAETAETADTAETAESTEAPETEPEAVPATVAAEAGESTALRPGDLDEARIAVWATADAEGFRVRIREAGNLFVDDPGFAVTTAAAVVTDAVNTL